MTDTEPTQPMALNGIAWNAEPDALAVLHEYALDNYDRATVRIAATCLVMEGLQWASTNGADKADQLGITYRAWPQSF